MGSFLILQARNASAYQIGPLFALGLELARAIPGESPSSVWEAGDVCAASFHRRNGSGSSLVVDPLRKDWLLGIGTWFHRDGYASGQEARLLQDFQASGIHALASKLEGFFALAIGDAHERVVYVVTDVVGSCHCFVRIADEGVALSNSSLLLASMGKSKPDDVACQEFISTGIIYEDRTLFRQVRKLAPASIYRFSQGTLQSTERYWRIADVVPESIAIQEASRALWSALKDSARRVEKAFPRPICDLTGGYDSRTLVAAFQSARVPISTVVTGSPDNPDVVISKGLAQVAGLPHLHLQSQPTMTVDRLRRALSLTDGEYDLVEYSAIQEVHQTLAGQFDISINGSFGEVARGYWWELLFPHCGRRQPLPVRKVAANRYAVRAPGPDLFLRARRIDLVRHLNGVVKKAVEGLDGSPNTFQMDQVYLSLRMQRWQGRIASSTNRIWPCLSPFMFRSVLELMLATQTRARRRSLLVRRMIDEHSPSLANYPRENGCPCVPVTWKNCYRFAPLLGYLGKKALKRAVRLAGLRGSAAGLPTSESPRMQLWSEREVRMLLDVDSMRLNALMEPAALDAFLRASQNPDFAFDARWNRVLTLECALRAADRAEKPID